MDNPQNQENAQQENDETSVKKVKGQSKAPPPADRLPGKSLLPTARVQKIMKADKDLPSCNKESVFLISVATEEFIKRLGRAAQQQAVREKRSTVQRKDLATAARRGEEFAFLEELLSVNIPGAASAPPTATTKRKPKTTSNVTPGQSIKDALSKSILNEKQQQLRNTEGNFGSISGFERGAQNNTHESDIAGGSQAIPDEEESMMMNTS